MIFAGVMAQTAEVSMRPLLGDWREEGGVWKTVGTRPSAGWYLRSQNQYGIGKFRFELKKGGGDAVFVYLRDWQLVLRGDSVTARYAGFTDGQGKSPNRYWDKYWFTATRPLSFGGGSWQAFEIELVSRGIVVRKDGEEVLRFDSPAREWTEKVNGSGKFRAFAPYQFPENLPGSSGERQVLVLHAFGDSLEARNISVLGTGGKPAEGFSEGEAQAEILPKDSDLPLLRPEGIVNVDWALPAAQAERIAALPAVGGWRIASLRETRPKAEDVGRKPAPGASSFSKTMVYSAGAEKPGEFPNTLVLNSRYPAFPQEGRIDFNLAEGGVYTLKFEWGNWGFGWGPNIVEVKVDGKPVLLDVYRPLMKFGVMAPWGEALPMRLEQGPHSISLALVTDRFGVHYHMKALSFSLSEISLEPGVKERWKVVDVRRPGEETQSSQATSDPASFGEWNGAALNYRLTGLDPGKSYGIKLFFFERDAAETGERIQEIKVGNNVVEADLDVFSGAGFGHQLTRSWEVRASEAGEIPVQLRGKGKLRKAFVNAVEVTDAGHAVFRENFGWHPFIAREAAKELNALPALAPEAVPPEPPRSAEDQTFDGFNLVANPHFSQADSQRKARPASWYSLDEIARPSQKNLFGDSVAYYKLLPGLGDYSLDSGVGRQGPGALRIGKTAPAFALTSGFRVTDPHKLQKFSFSVRGESGAASVQPVFLWFAINMDAWGGALPAPRIQYIGTSVGDAVKPDGNWQDAVVSAKPPPETVFGLAAIQVSENAGSSIWIDDAEWSGFGAEPLEITCSQAGYHPQSIKKAIAKSFSPGKARWALKQLPDGSVVAKGESETFRTEWFTKRHYFDVDFSSLETPGEYVLEVFQDDRTVSSPVLISRDIYRDLAAMMLGALHNKRVNCEVENAHDPDLLDYARSPQTLVAPSRASYEPLHIAERIDLIGGYYDAGDAIKHTEFWPSVVLATAEAADFPPDAGIRSLAEPEKDWILAAFHKFALEDGTLMTTAKPQGSGLDNIPMYSFDPVPAEIRNVQQVAGSCAMAAYLLRDTDPGLSKKYLGIAEANYNNPGLWKVVAAADKVGPREISAAAKTLWAEMYLSEISQAADYKSRMEKSARVLAEGLKNRAYKDLVEMFQAADLNGAAIQDCVWVPARFVRLHPDDPAVPALKEGLRAFADHVSQLSASTLWGQAAAMNGAGDGHAPGLFPSYGDNALRNVGYWPMLAYSLAETGMVLEDPGIIRLAERQLQWCLGNNMADLSVVQGVGERFAAGGDLLWWQDRFFNHWLESRQKALFFPGYVPTAAFRDVGTGKPASEKTPGAPAYPQSYLVMCAQPPYGIRPGGVVPSEVYLPQIAQFTLAMTKVAEGLRWIEENAPSKK